MEKSSLNSNDRQRIEQASLLYSGNHNLSSHLFNGFIKGAEYATRYEREKQAKEVEALKKEILRLKYKLEIFLESKNDA